MPMEANRYHSLPPSYDTHSNSHKSQPNTFDTRPSVYPPAANARYNLKPDAHDRSYLDKYGRESESRNRSSSAERLLKRSTSEKQTLDTGLYGRGIERSKSERNVSESVKRYLSEPYSPERPRSDLKPYSDKYSDYSHVPHPPTRPKGNSENLSV